MEVSEQARLMSGLLTNVGLGVAGSATSTAIVMLRRALGLNPRDGAIRVNLAALLTGAGEDEEAEQLVRSVLAHNPDVGTAWQILGVIETHRGDLARAIACFTRALQLDPESGQRKFDLAAAHLRAGDFARGLPLYEDRGLILPRNAAPVPGAPWTGEHSRHIAVWGDQGYGDRIMFARFLPWVREHADKVTFLTDPHTVALMSGYAGICEVASSFPPEPGFEHQVCVSSLPLIFGLTPDTIPPDPGLIAAADTTDHLVSSGLKIGIAWAGNPSHPNDNIRSMRFADLLPLAADPRNELFSLQCGKPSAEIAQERAQRIVRDMTGLIEGEWTHTAALIKNLDVVITVDTAIAHLAGALGVRTFLMLPVFSDWRWLWGRDDSPWYPSMQLFRQSRVGDYKGVVDRVRRAVDGLHEERALVGMINRRIAMASFEKEPEVASLLRRVLRPGDTFVDVGANAGIHTRLGAELVGPTGTVLAFEPGANILPALRELIAARGLKQVELIEQPVSNEAGEVTFHLCVDDSGGNALWDPGLFETNARTRETPATVRLEATTLDREVLGRGLSPRLIKIDVEGAEERVLEGAVELLMSCRPPFVVTELHGFGLALMGCSQASLRGLMASFGYSTFQLFADGSLPMLVPPETEIQTGLIVNLLFSTPDAVAEIWPAMQINSPHLRPIHAYGMAASAA